MHRDRRIVFAAGFLRAVANGLIGVVAGIYLAELGFEPATWGAIPALASPAPLSGRRA
jgi:hypothetical protein